MLVAMMEFLKGVQLMRQPRQFAAVALVAAVALLAAAPPAGAVTCQSMAIPAYFYPGSAWDQAIAAAPRVSTMVMNPASGPGVALDPNYLAKVRQAQARGIQVLGYVHTSYGQRNSGLVRTEIQLYWQWYGVNGIFLDEVASSASALPYYRDLAAYIRQQASQRIVLNPGVAPDEGYMSVGDVIVVFEGTFASYVPLRLPTWINRYPGTRFAHLVHATTSSQLRTAMDLSKQRNAGFVYVTDDGMPNPWDRLPTYWTQELAQLCR